MTNYTYNEYEDYDYMTEDEFYDASALLQDTIEDIRIELTDMVYLWMGHANFQFATLTPDVLTELNYRCLQLKKMIRDFLSDVDVILRNNKIDDYGMMAGDYEDLIHNMEFELELLQVIQKSYEFSSGKSQGMDGLVDLSFYDTHFKGYKRHLLNPVTVTPWIIPEVPKLTVPERPSVVLKVTKVSDCAPRISAGLDDIFYEQPLVVELLVDEDVKVGDIIIVKTDGWKGIGHELQKPEYDGLAEPDCPCSEMTEVMEVEYNFDLEFELEQHEARWRKQWIDKHFKFETEHEIRMSGKVTYHDLLNPRKVKKVIGGWTEYKEEYE